MDDKTLRERYLELEKHKNDPNGDPRAEFYLVSMELDERERATESWVSPRQKTREAVTWCVRKYKKLKEAKTTNISLRGIAREATDLFFPNLSPARRAKMISTLRISYLKKVGRRGYVTK